MTFSKLFARCAYFGSRGSSQSSHHPNKQSIGFSNQTHGFHWSNIQTKRALNKSSTMQKIKDTILLMEATKGPTTKATIGTCQGLGTAAMVFGTGYTIALLTCGLEENPQRHPLLTDIQLENGANAVLDTASIRSYLEERRKIIDERISLTYFHIVSSLVAAGLTSVLSFRMFKNKAFLVQIANRPMVAVGAGVITPFLMGYVVRSLPRTPNPDGNMIPFGMKELGHLLYAGSLGLVAAPLYLLGGHSMVRAAYVTAGCFAGTHNNYSTVPKHIFFAFKQSANLLETIVSFTKPKAFNHTSHQIGLHGVSKVIPRTALLEQEAPLVIAVNAVLVSFLSKIFEKKFLFY